MALEMNWAAFFIFVIGAAGVAVGWHIYTKRKAQNKDEVEDETEEE